MTTEQTLQQKTGGYYEDLIVWKKGIALIKHVYILTKKFPDDERYGLTSKMRRSAVSIPSNIAEGQRRGTRKDFSQFLRIAYGSTGELHTQIIIAKELLYIDDETFKTTSQHIDETERMLNKFIQSLSS
jgi:four helix bundle protein